MIQHSTRERLVAMPMAALAGFVDAVAFLHLGGYFVSFMTGNTTRLGASIAEANGRMWLPALLIVLFVSGVVAGTLVRQAAVSRGQGWVMVLVTAMLALAGLASIAGFPWLAMGALAVAMGAENAVFERNGEVSIGVTYMTGTLVKMGQRIASALRGGSRTAWAWYGLLWLGLALGAVMGAGAFLAFGLGAIWIAVAVSVTITVFFFLPDPANETA